MTVDSKKLKNYSGVLGRIKRPGHMHKDCCIAHTAQKSKSITTIHLLINMFGKLGQYQLANCTNASYEAKAVFCMSQCHTMRMLEDYIALSPSQ